MNREIYREKNSPSQLRGKLKMIGQSIPFAFHRSNFAKKGRGHVEHRLAWGMRMAEDGGQHNGITNDFTSSDPQGSHIDTIGYRDTRAETPVG